MCFEDLRLSEPLLRAVRAAGYRTPTPIQQNAIPHVLAGRDVLGCAQTGTGKTAAFALPILQRLGEKVAQTASSSGARPPIDHKRASRSPRQRSQSRRTRNGHQESGDVAAVRALVLCPTRELAQQIHGSFSTYGVHTGIRAVAVFGGVSQHPQVRAIRAGADVIIATPGRLLDLMEQRLVSLAGVEIVVLDEADRMLDMGFIPDIRRILADVPRQRQSLLFSATMPAPIRALASEILQNPIPVEVARVSSPAVTVAHWVYHVERPQKVSLLVHLLERAAGTRALVFTRTKHGADRLAGLLAKAGVRAGSLHGNKSQNARTYALNQFRSAQTPVLVATDVAARGLDVADIAQVINYDLTPDPETYVHRIGRTGRAGAAGTAVSFCTSEDRGNLRAIERMLRAPLQHAAVPPLKDAPLRRRLHKARMPLVEANASRNLQRDRSSRHSATRGRRRAANARRAAVSAEA